MGAPVGVEDEPCVAGGDVEAVDAADGTAMCGKVGSSAVPRGTVDIVNWWVPDTFLRAYLSNWLAMSRQRGLSPRYHEFALPGSELIVYRLEKHVGLLYKQEPHAYDRWFGKLDPLNFAYLPIMLNNVSSQAVDAAAFI